MNVFLHICLMCFMCYDIVTSLNAVECDVVYHLSGQHQRWLSKTVRLVIPGLDILFTSSFLTYGDWHVATKLAVGEPCRTFLLRGDICHGRVQTCRPMGACIACLVISVGGVCGRCWSLFCCNINAMSSIPSLSLSSLLGSLSFSLTQHIHLCGRVAL